MATIESKIKNATLKGFDKGLVSNVTNEALKDKEFPILKNWDTDNRGGFVRRLGYKNIMPNPSIDGVQQGYIQFIAKPYGIEDIDQLFNFENHLTPKETETALETRLLAVSGKLYLVETSEKTTEVFKTSDVFIPEKRGWIKEITFSNVDELEVSNDSFGKLKLMR